jgi:hypothetical protein
MTNNMTLITSLLFIIIGINLVANNIIHGLITKYIFKKDTISKIVIRVLGILCIINSLLLLNNFIYYFTLIDILIIIIVLFFTIHCKNSYFYSKRKISIINSKIQLEEKKRNIETLRSQIENYINNSNNSKS